MRIQVQVQSSSPIPALQKHLQKRADAETTCALNAVFLFDIAMDLFVENGLQNLVC
jgi:hypothetical protein